MLIKVGARVLTNGELTEVCACASLSPGEAVALKKASAGTVAASVVDRLTGKEVEPSGNEEQTAW